VVVVLSLRGLVEDYLVSKTTNHRLSVLCCGRFFDDTPGGIQTHTLHLMKSLQDEVDFVHAVTSRSSIGSALRAAKRVPVIRTPSWNVDGSIAISPALITQTRRLHDKRRFDLVHLHFPDPMSHLASMMLPSQIPRVISWHADIVRQKTMRLFYGPFLKQAVRRAAAVIVATPSHVSSSAVLGPMVSDDRIKVVPFGFDLSAFLEDAPQKKAIAAKYPGRRVFAAGRHVSYKGFDVLINAVAKLPPDVILLLGGSGPLTNDLRQLAQQLGVTRRVEFLGFVPDDLLPAYYQASDVFCLPSVTQAEAFGIVQVEAMACGKPVVSTRLNNGVDFVNEHGKTGITVQPGDPVALANALSNLLHDEKKAHMLGANGRAKAQTEYSADKMAERILGIYRSAVNQPE
jgi:glycosyltransferase involved in cell wall biosynthesis